MVKDWIKKLCVYQIYPRSFCDSNGDGIGDLRGITSKLDYLKSLGINAVWLSPVYASPNRDFGYDISDYYAINPEYGTMADFDDMLCAMHERGIKLIMDLVINHTSSEHKWFEESRKSKDNPYRGYYHWRPGKNGKPPNNWTSFFTGGAWEHDSATGEYYLHLFDKHQPDLNYFNPKVVEEAKSVLRFWLDKGVDGFRCDVITLLSKAEGLPDGKPRIALRGSEHFINGPKIHELLGGLKRNVLDKYDCMTVGEGVFMSVPSALSYTAGENKQLDMMFTFEHMNADNALGIKYLIRKYRPAKLKRALANWQTGLHGKGWNALYMENHDQPRSVGRYCSKTYAKEGGKMLATMLLCLSGTPFIYQGQEIGMTNYPFSSVEEFQDVESKNAYSLFRRTLKNSHARAFKKVCYFSRDNARTPMQWSAQPGGGFTGGTPWLGINPNHNTVNVEWQESDQNSLLNYYRQLIALRKKFSALREGEFTEYFKRSPAHFVYRKSHGGQDMLVILNCTQKPVRNRIPKGIDLSSAQLLLSSYTVSGAPPMQLRPYEALVYLLTEQKNN